MKKTDLTQKTIVHLDLDELSTIIKEEDKNKELLGYWDIWSGNFNEVLLHRFGYLKGTYEALQLLGIILDGIQYSLKFKYFITNVLTDDPNKIYCIEGKIDEEYQIIVEQVYSGDEVIENWTYEHPILQSFIKYHEYEVKLEAKNVIKYYKEYFTRIFDRARTLK